VEGAGQSVVHKLEKLAGVRDHQSEASTVAPIVAGSVVVPNPPAMMSDLVAVATPVLSAVASGAHGAVENTERIAPLVSLTE
jgi:hypothetical protein